MTNDHELHRGQDNRAMAKLGGSVGGALAFALTLGLAFDGGARVSGDAGGWLCGHL